MAVRQFEELIAWQKARALTKAIYQLTRERTFARDFGLSGQMQRAAVSIMSNIAEGFERTGLKEFYNFVAIAKGSCAELRSQLYVASDIGYITDSAFKNVSNQAQEVAKILGGLRTSLLNQINSKKTKKG